MARDPLATAGVVMIDQARSIRDQLRAVKPARAALANLGEDADALAARVGDALLRAEGALVAATRKGRAQKGDREAAKAVVASAARWLAALDGCLRIGEASQDAVVRLACAQVRAVIPRERRSFVGAQRTAVAVMPLLRMHAATLAGVAGMSAVLEQGEASERELDAHHRALIEASAEHRGALAAAKEQRLALLATLREVRRLWASAALIAPVAVPALDLRIGKSAVTAAKRLEPEAVAPEVLAPTADGAEPPDGAVAVAGGVDGAEPDPGACAAPRVVAQVVVAVG